MSQPDPVPGVEAVGPLVIKDVAERMALGMSRYGTPLQTFNGRRSLVDAYEELLDLLMYLRQFIAEQDFMADAIGAAMREMCDIDEPVDSLPAREARAWKILNTALHRWHSVKERDE
jgi:hypothetical protein